MMQSSTSAAPEREALKNVIAQWNANRLDIFELSEPNEVKYMSLSCIWPNLNVTFF